MINLYPHQIEELKATENKNRVAYYHDMGLGKTFVGAEKLIRLGSKINLVVCQKSKVQDWLDHFKNNGYNVDTWDLTNNTEFECFFSTIRDLKWITTVGVINYDLVWRRPELKKLSNFTLLLDESSLIQNEQAKRSKFILSLKPDNVILLSGTPTGGKYERLWSQMKLLGWNISKQMFYDHYVEYHYDNSNGFPLMVIDGYKNEDRLKRKMREYGCRFLKTEEVFDLPGQVDQNIYVPKTKEYRVFKRDSIVIIKDEAIELIGNTVLTKLLYERQLCGQYNKDKLNAFEDLILSTNDRLIVFYNFNDELKKLRAIASKHGRNISLVNGIEKNLDAYNNCNDSITFIQYQAGAMGLNLQLANKIIYFTPPLSSELFEQSKKRIHRIGQTKSCFYYYLICTGSIEKKIYKTLAMRRDYTEELFKNGT